MTREEAIEVIIKNYPHVTSSGSQFESAIRELVPELAESEDERIRKELLEYAKRHLADFEAHKKLKYKTDQDNLLWWRNVVAYLEKQKEQKPESGNSEKPNDHAERSEEDEEHLDSIIESYKELLKDYSANHGVDYIPYNTPVVARTVLNDIKFLKSLRSQPKQDYKGLAISFMNYLDENRSEDKMCLSNGECADIEQAFQDMDWGRIIRYAEKYQPHWKPSQEQMEALESAVQLYKDTHYEIHHEKIVSLYEQLKKLI